MIEVSGYVAEEKLNIAKSYLVPQCRKDRLILFLIFTMETICILLPNSNFCYQIKKDFIKFTLNVDTNEIDE